MSRILIIGGQGYIGSVLTNHLKDLNIDTLDNEWFGCYSKNIKQDAFDFKDYHKYNQIVLLAAHSSVIMAKNHPQDAFKNNIILFEHVLNQLDDDQKLIYASSAAIYNGNAIENEDQPFHFQALNMYDLSKYVIDQLAKINNKNYYGLRFGTVCGYSPNFRNDTIINRMTQTAIEKNKVELSNGNNRRGILGLIDLCNAIELILKSDINKPGIYNLCSYNDYIKNIATDIAETLKVPIDESFHPTTTYDFTISSDKFKQTFGWKPTQTTKSITLDLKEKWQLPLCKRYE